jgi:hypothetical protein
VGVGLKRLEVGVGLKIADESVIEGSLGTKLVTTTVVPRFTVTVAIECD